MVLYESTRGGNEGISSAEAIKRDFPNGDYMFLKR